MSRAYSRENLQQFQKACATFATHLSKSNDENDDEENDGNSSTNFPQAYTKKIAGSIFYVALSPYVYGSKASRDAIHSVLTALVRSNLMENSSEVCAQIFLKSNTNGEGSKDDAQRSLQLVRLGSALVAAFTPVTPKEEEKKKEEEVTLSSWQVAVLTQLLEMLTSLLSTKSMSKNLITIRKHAAKIFLRKFRQNYPFLAKATWDIIEESPSTRIGGVAALLTVGGITSKSRGINLFVTHVLQGQGASSSSSSSSMLSFIPLFESMETSDFRQNHGEAKDEGGGGSEGGGGGGEGGDTLGKALSVSLKRRQDTIVPLLQCLLESLPKDVDLSSICSEILFDPLLSFWRSGVETMEGDDISSDPVRASCVSSVGFFYFISLIFSLISQ